MQLKDLRPNKKNPRKISSKKQAMLKASVEKFGDLSGFVFNRNTGALISGHQRQKVLPQDSKIKIEHKYETPTLAKTVAEGYVLIDGEKFKYREVDADETWEMEALLAANKHGGEWDKDLLRVAIADIGNLEITGFDIPELEAMNIAPPQVKIETVQSDEEYVKNTPQTTEQIPTENPSNQVFEKTEEKKMDVVGKRFVIIIDCKDAEHKETLKEQIRGLVSESGANFF